MRVYLVTFVDNSMSYPQVRSFLEIKGAQDIKASDVQQRFKTLICILNVNTKTQEPNCTFLALKLLGLNSLPVIIQQKWFGFVWGLFGAFFKEFLLYCFPDVQD